MLKNLLTRLVSLEEEINQIRTDLVATISESFDLESLDLKEFMESTNVTGMGGIVRDRTDKEWAEIGYGEDEDNLGEPGAEDEAEMDDALGDDDDLGDDDMDFDLDLDDDSDNGEEGDIEPEAPSTFAELEDGEEFQLPDIDQIFTKTSTETYEDEEGNSMTISSTDSKIIPVEDEAPEDDRDDDLEGDELGDADLDDDSDDIDLDDESDEVDVDDEPEVEPEADEEEPEEITEETKKAKKKLTKEAGGLSLQEAAGLDDILQGMITEAMEKKEKKTTKKVEKKEDEEKEEKKKKAKADAKADIKATK